MYILALLATYFWARTITTLDGPGGIFSAVRERIDPEQTTWIGRGLNCPICAGFYIAGIVALFTFPLSFPAFVLDWFALAGANMVLHLVLSKGE